MGAQSDYVPNETDWRANTFEFFKTIWLQYFKGAHKHWVNVIFVVLWVIGLWLFVIQFSTNDDATKTKTNGRRAVLLNSFSQDDPNFIEYVRMNINDTLRFPNGTEHETILTSNQRMDKFSPSVMIMNYVYKYLINEGANKRERFYVEIGTGHGISVSYRLDTIYHWKGLIIESDMEAYEKIMISNRQALVGNFCVSPLPFFSYRYYGIKYLPQSKDDVQNECYPLHTVLSALRIQSVDFLSVFSYGTEINILKTLPKNFIAKVIYIDNRGSVDDRSVAELSEYMKNRKYSLVHEVVEDQQVIGYIFVYKYIKNVEF